MEMKKNYLEKELNVLFTKDSSLFEFLQLGSLDGVWYWDLENLENEWLSPRFWTLLGYAPEEKEHLASEWQDLIHPDDLKTALENFNKHCADPNHPYDQVVRYKHKDGSTVWVRCRGIVIRDEKGKPVRMLGAHNDLTKLKEIESKLLAKTDELEKANAQLRKTISGIIPICASCNKIRDDNGYWTRLESFIRENSTAEFSHGICPGCHSKLYPDFPPR